MYFNPFFLLDIPLEFYGWSNSVLLCCSLCSSPCVLYLRDDDTLRKVRRVNEGVIISNWMFRIIPCNCFHQDEGHVKFALWRWSKEWQQKQRYKVEHSKGSQRSEAPKDLEGKCQDGISRKGVKSYLKNEENWVVKQCSLVNKNVSKIRSKNRVDLWLCKCRPPSPCHIHTRSLSQTPPHSTNGPPLLVSR